MIVTVDGRPDVNPRYQWIIACNGKHWSTKYNSIREMHVVKELLTLLA